jgi:hypothetical protein
MPIDKLFCYVGPLLALHLVRSLSQYSPNATSPKLKLSRHEDVAHASPPQSPPPAPKYPAHRQRPFQLNHRFLASTAGSSSRRRCRRLILQPGDIEAVATLGDLLAGEATEAADLAGVLTLRQASGPPSGSSPKAASNAAKCCRVSTVRLPNWGMLARRS